MTTSDGSTGPGPDYALVGRERELRALRDFLRTATRSGGVQVVSGDAGMGKSVLLEAAVGVAVEAHGARVLRASGVEFESDLGYAGLNQLLLPLTDALIDLPDRHATALRAALGLQWSEPPELLTLATATVGLLRRRRTRPPPKPVGSSPARDLVMRV